MAAKVNGLGLKIMRLKSGLRQYEVAGQVGIPANRLSEIESGRREPSPELLERLFEVIKHGQHGNVRNVKRGRTED